VPERTKTNRYENTRSKNTYLVDQNADEELHPLPLHYLHPQYLAYSPPYTPTKLLNSLQEMGEGDKEQNPTPAGIYTKESVGKVT